MLRSARIVWIVWTAMFATAAIASEQSSRATPTELPRGVRPTHYDIALTPNAQALTFTGQAAITLEVLQPTTSLTLHALDLQIASARLTNARRTLPAPRIDLDPQRQTATFTFPAQLAAGTYRLALEYTGKIMTSPTGLFAIDYDTSAGKRRALYTQLATADARRVFPGWDEPAFKATFSLAATVPAEQVAVSNMPIANRTLLDGGRALVAFERTPQMSTYLLLFALGEFDRFTAQAGPTEVGIITRRGVADQGRFALDSSVRVLNEMNDYFGMPYPLPKLDNIAVPSTSQAFAAMENWGAILSFEFALLLDPTISTQKDKQNVFEIAAHEIAHQWFGNLVTMRWWDDLWLNESFASWLEGRTTARLHPEWDTTVAAVNTRESAMDRDSLLSTHPIVQPIETVNEANQAFDAITYLKGNAVLAMLESYVGDDAWRRGVQQYIKAHAYGNTVSDDLWRAIEAASREPVGAIARDFTLQQGVPLIRVETADCREERTTLRLTQAEFSRDQPHKEPLRWRVPVIAQSLHGAAAERALVTGTAELTLPTCAPVIVNAGQSGYYRTLYTPAPFAALTHRFAELAAVDQLGLLSDSWALGLTGHQPISDFFALTTVVPLDANPYVWGKVARTFAAVDDYYGVDSPARRQLRERALTRLAPKFAQLGWVPQRDEPDPLGVLRVDLIDALGALGDRSVIHEARRRFAAQSSDSNAMPGSVRKAIMGVVARHADEPTWNRLHAAARTEKTPLVRAQLYTLLGAPEDPALARRALELALTPEPGPANSLAIIAGVARLHADMAFEFALAHLPQLHDMLDPLTRVSFVPYLARTSATEGTIDKVEAYAKEHLPAEARRSATTAAASIKDRMRVRRERLPELNAWLAAAR